MSTKPVQPVQPVIFHQLVALAVHPNGLPSRLGWACDSRRGESAHVDVTVNCPKCIANNQCDENMTEYRCETCGHSESDHRSIPPYHCQHGMAQSKLLCECPVFIEENCDRLDAEYEAQKYDDMLEQYR